MTWAEARTALRAALAETGYHVHHVPPQTLDAPRPQIVLSPPARDVERMPAGIQRTTYRQVIRVLGLASDEGEVSLDEAGDAVDDAVEAVNRVLAQHIQLGGAAVSVSEPQWDELTVRDYPANTGLPHAIMACELEIVIDEALDYGV